MLGRPQGCAELGAPDGLPANATARDEVPVLPHPPGHSPRRGPEGRVGAVHGTSVRPTNIESGGGSLREVDDPRGLDRPGLNLGVARDPSRQQRLDRKQALQRSVSPIAKVRAAETCLGWAMPKLAQRGLDLSARRAKAPMVLPLCRPLFGDGATYHDRAQCSLGAFIPPGGPQRAATGPDIRASSEVAEVRPAGSQPTQLLLPVSAEQPRP